MEEVLRDIVAAALEVDRASIGPETSMESVESWDSLKHLEIVMAIEERFGIELEVDDIVEMVDFAGIERTVVKRTSGV